MVGPGAGVAEQEVRLLLAPAHQAVPRSCRFVYALVAVPNQRRHGQQGSNSNLFTVGHSNSLLKIHAKLDNCQEWKKIRE